MSKLYSRLLILPFKSNKSFFLFGPRGTGKTTCVMANVPHALYFDLLNTGLYRQLISNPERLDSMIPASFDDWVVLDEVQKAPLLLNEVHRLIEQKKYKFILTGSSARSLRKKGVNLLAGRAFTYYLYPLISQEIGNDFDLSKMLTCGCLPAALQEQDFYKYLESYVHTYLREEVLQEGLTRNIGDFARFLEVASFSQGSQINLNSVARETGVSQKIVASYFNILEDLLLSCRLFPFAKKAKRRLVMHPKFYFFDVGVYRYLRPMGPFDRPEEVSGISLESLFFQELRAVNDYFQFHYQLYYWQASNGLEVDFVAYGERGIIAFEIKHTKTIDSKDLRSLKAFQSDYGIAKLYLIYGGDHREYHGDIQGLPFEDALKNLHILLGGESSTLGIEKK